MMDRDVLPDIRALVQEGGSSYVYFITGGDFSKRAAVKIGTASSPLRRVRELQTAHFQTLRLVAEIPGDGRLERALHVAFRASHIRGEWYWASDEMRSLVDEMVVSSLGNFSISDRAA